MINPRFLQLAKRQMNRGVSKRDLRRSIREASIRRAIEAEKRKKTVTINPNSFQAQKSNNHLTLESEVEFSKNIHNEFILEADGQDVLYAGYAQGLHFSDNVENIEGFAAIRRYDHLEKPKKIIRVTNWFPPKIQTVKESWKERWLFGTYYSTRIVDYDVRFISYGETVDLENSVGYKSQLLVAAAKKGIKLSPELFDAVFGPIDKQIMEMYRNFKKD